LTRDLFDRRCAEVLDAALDRVEAYRSWRAFDRGASASVDDRYRALPALTKRLMNHHAPAAFVPRGRSLEQALRDGEVELVATSGTTEDRIQNVWYQPWWNASERASWALNTHARRAATGDHREALLANPLNVGIRSEHPLPLEQRRLARFLYLNELVDPLAWPESHLRRMLDELAVFQPAILEGNPSLLSRLCRFAARAGVRAWQPALVSFTYEYPSLIHRRHVGAVFDAPLMSSYGTTEAAYVFIECEHGCMHQNVESCRVDFLPFAAEHGSPSVGLLLVTTFDNPWRALIRFDPGDLGRLADGPCPCGRTEGLTLSSVEGRAVNLTLTPEGRLVTQAEVDRRLATVPGLDEYQLLQTDGRSYALRVGSDTHDPGVVEAAGEALRLLYGPAARVSVSASGPIGPESSGKYRLVKASFPVDTMSFVEPGFRPPVPPEGRIPPA
jgi:phenylacetate-coenzyme A ligase PaaK-like adenylate-forming protein